jgi:short-subunit dehydrogenase
MEQNQTGRPLALITGASSGLGAVFARRLAREGYDLVLVARRKERLESLAEKLRQSTGIFVETLPADLSQDDALRLVEERIASAPNFEFLVNNAGFGTMSLFHKADVASQDAMHRLHVLATMRLTHAALPGMLARKKGYIVNVSSVASFLHGPGNVSYCSTKAWMNSFTEGIYVELQYMRSDVRVQALCPGYTITEFHHAMGIDRSFVSRGWWMPAEKVVDDSLAGLKRGKLFVIPGLRYKLIVLVLKFLPAFLLHTVAKRGPANRMKQAAHPKRET